MQMYSLAQMQVLKRFEADPDLECLEQMLGEFDAFAFLGVSRTEETHSRILAWLLDPQENHSMGDSFLVKFLLKTKAATEEKIRDTDWAKTTVQREWHNVVDGDIGFLDILVLNREAEYLCAIENKVFSTEHSEQLTRYRSALGIEFGTFCRSHVFVTRHGLPPGRTKERAFWISVDYGTILQLVEDTIHHAMRRSDESVVAFLRQYVTTLRRRIVPDTDIANMAHRLYLRHGEAIDLIFGQREALIPGLRDICREAIDRCGDWTLIGDRVGGRLVYFQSESHEPSG